MTQFSHSALVLEGNEVKLRLQAERAASNSYVHVDWLRFTCFLRNVVPSFLTDSSTSDFNASDYEHPVYCMDMAVCKRIHETVRQFEREHVDPAMRNAMDQARSLALEVCEALGSGFSVYPEIRKGHDFYRYRWSIVRNDAECGWVGFLASGDSPTQQAQAATIHCNLYGVACTFGDHGWNERLASIVDTHDAKITRADLALDFFDGFTGGMSRVVEDYQAGLMNVRGNKPKCNQVGDWVNGAERSFYFGSKEAGKQTNVYEKGDQLYGREHGSKWLRIELRYGNKLRVLPSDILRRPADFFAGGSSWHQLMLSKAATDQDITPRVIKTAPRAAVETVAGEVARNVRWMLNTAAQSFSTALRFMTEDQLNELCDWNVNKFPARLRNFSVTELQRAFDGRTRSIAANTGPVFMAV